MDQTNEQATPQPMDFESAYSLVYGQVYAPTFFEKLASHGIVPKDNEEAETMLKMANQLRVAYDLQERQESGSLLEKAANHLNDQLSAMGYNQTPQEDAVEKQIKQAAHATAQDPAIANALLSMAYHQQQQEQQTA